MLSKTELNPHRDLTHNCYRLAFWTTTIFMGAWLYGMGAWAIVLMFTTLLDAGNHLFASGTLNLSGPIINATETFMDGRNGLILVSWLAIGGVMLTLERGPALQLVAAVACIGLHIMLIGAIL